MKTFFLIALEIAVSTLIAWFIGSKLTLRLTHLKRVAITMANNEPYDKQIPKGDDELNELYKTMIEMHQTVEKRNSELYRIAHYDILSGLPNRFFITQELEKILYNAQDNQEHVMLLLLDIDDFKVLNDSFGHIVGDAAITKIAKRFSYLHQFNNRIARMGGDEFLLILENSSPKSINQAIADILDSFSTPISVDMYKFDIHFSIGIAEFPNDGTTVSETHQKRRFGTE